jgi:hypothetical protein
MRKVIAIPVVAGLLGFAGLAAPLAAHASTADIPVTFDLSGGSLSIQEPSSATLTATVGETQAEGSLGDVSVIDDRGSDSGSWTATAQASDFQLADSETDLPVDAVTYTVGSISGDTEVGTFAASSDDPIAIGGDGPAAEVVTAADEDGNAAVTWNPTLTLTLPSAGVVAGTYSGTITESVG